MTAFRAALPLLLLLGAAPVRSAPPNVVVLLADDAGWGDYGFTGNRSVRTPRLDALAAQSARFERFYVSAVCAPTRAEFLTGRWHPRGGVRGVSTGQERLDLSERTLADAFRAAGYATGAFGKWHNGSQWPYHPRARGFGEYFGYTSGHWGEYFDPPLEQDGRMVRSKGYIVDVCTDRALDFIGRHRERPFFCYVPFTTPHSPWGVPAEDWARWKDRELLQGVPGEKPDETRCVLAMMENLDRNVGRILDRLDSLKLSEDTVVVYFSDNGPNTLRWTGGLKGRKGSLDEGGLRSPLLVRWPGRIAPGLSIRPIAGAVDLLPTLLGLTGVARLGDKPLDGASFAGALLGKGPAPDGRLLFSHQNGKVSVRSPRFRLDPAGALFDLDADPGQTRNAAADHPEEAARLAAAVASWRREVLAEAGRDERPFPVGYREFPVTMLPARDGVPHGGMKRSANAPNSSYFVNWKTLDDSATWDVDLAEAGEYRVSLEYTCPLADEGATIELSLGGARLEGRVEPGWDPPLYANQDTIPRPPAESKMKEFRPLELGTVRLPAGRGLLRIRALKIPGGSVMDLRRLTLELLP
jgi:arylsulfatase A-like enzyme